MGSKLAGSLLAILLFASIHHAQAQPAKVYRVGVIYEGGPFAQMVKGLQDGLKELGLEEGKQYRLEIRDLKGDRNAAEAAARSLERLCGCVQTR